MLIYNLEFAVWAQEKTRARERDTPCVSPSRASVLSFAHYFQAPATQATVKKLLLAPIPLVSVEAWLGRKKYSMVR